MSTFLITGGTGKTGKVVAQSLRAQGHEPRIGSRSPGAEGVIAFDWYKDETWAAALDGVAGVWLVAPSQEIDMIGVMRPFLDLAMQEGRRLVLLSALCLKAGGPLMGAVHAYLRDEASSWLVLRPSWFMQNFTEGLHRASIREQGVIFTAAGEGRTGFVDAADIGAVGATILPRADQSSGELVITGPQSLSYADAAAMLTHALGRPIRHQSVSETDLAERFEAMGMSPRYAPILAGLNAGIARGDEDVATSVVRDVAGRAPTALADFFARDVAALR